jgi:probable rRNA maturation factor
MHMTDGKIIKINSKTNRIVDLELQIATSAKTLPHPSQFKSWVSVILKDKLKENIELTIRIVDESEIIDLNHRYRNKNKATNVLSFPIELDFGADLDYRMLGDIIICASVVEKEAREQNKELLAHWAHMVVHGLLHLLGYDHENPEEANIMESLESELLQNLGFKSPYSV